MGGGKVSASVWGLPGVAIGMWPCCNYDIMTHIHDNYDIMTHIHDIMTASTRTMVISAHDWQMVTTSSN